MVRHGCVMKVKAGFAHHTHTHADAAASDDDAYLSVSPPSAAALNCGMLVPPSFSPCILRRRVYLSPSLLQSVYMFIEYKGLCWLQSGGLVADHNCIRDQW